MCEYTGYEFGATYPDSVCIDGFLWDADSGYSDGEDGWNFTFGGDLPCPKCNMQEHNQHIINCMDEFDEDYDEEDEVYGPQGG